MKMISFPDVLRFALNARKGPLIPEGFILETLPEKPTPLRHELKSRQSPAFRSPPPSPITSQPPESLFTSPVSQTPSGSVTMTRNDSTETLVDIIVQPAHLKSILILHTPAHEVRQTRRISFADTAIMPCPGTPTTVASMGQVAEETLGQGEDLMESLPRASSLPTQTVAEARKTSRRKSIMRTMSLLAPPVYRGKAWRLSVPNVASLTRGTDEQS